MMTYVSISSKGRCTNLGMDQIYLTVFPYICNGLGFLAQLSRSYAKLSINTLLIAGFAA